jgi:predicted MFS family arabinose efflux permease
MLSAPSERRLLLLVGFVQFVNVLDFMMVVPLGPDFARALGIPSSALGLVVASYMVAAALSGAIGALFLDRFGRRKALALALCGLAIGTSAGALATSLGSMLLARLLAGAFGGPATSLTLAVISDVVPPDRRGRAMGAVMGAFSLASVLGVPASLELARLGGWRLPFLAVAVLGAGLAAATARFLPPLDRHLSSLPVAPSRAAEVLRRPTAILALLATGAVMTGQFALVPNIPAYWQLNLGYPRERLGLLFVAGGIVSFATMRLAGRLADRAGAAVTTAAATAIYAVVVLAAFVFPVRDPPALALFVGFMAASSFRVVPMQALSSRVPAPWERARFMSGQSVVQHLGSAAGAFVASRMLGELPGGGLAGMGDVAWLALVLAGVVPWLLWRVELRVRRAEAGVKHAAPRSRELPRAVTSPRGVEAIPGPPS